MTDLSTPSRPAAGRARPGAPPRHRRQRRPRRPCAWDAPSPAQTVVRYGLLLVVLFVAIGPFLWQLSTSLKGPGEDIYTPDPSFVPEQPTLGNYAAVADAIPVWQYVGNSLTVAALTVGGNIVFATLAGFALARLSWAWRGAVLALFIATLVLPPEATIISQFLVVRDLGLADSLVGVALPGMVATLNVLLMYNAFRQIPLEIDQAAIVDGANAWQRLRFIGLPAVRGTLAVITIFAFIAAWDDFLWPLIVLQSPDNLTLTVGLQYLQGTFGADQRAVAAGTLIAFVPIAVLFVAMQRYFFKGVEEGGVKG
ncbi:carbohydrate ABC transporter permease [Pseudonocardia sp. HH130630-07]|uniref:carbohydrate ABC transporter permease n=1 Tax=Pseudonocardia sp. HH130630-07 TaxID=1690815 RepID=UPI0008150223|nr:carbohydrate ABC transporter permease [Pseudonocardia sp. HH130630-07]ANY09080.1 ABC transporter permease [Pseudonocardia sp. HH130630-07]